jgi:hypothetical protein
MKTKKFNKKLVFIKKTITNLDMKNLNSVRGGDPTDPPAPTEKPWVCTIPFTISPCW